MGTNYAIYGPFTAALPYLEEQNVQELYHFDLAYTDPANQQAIEVKLEVYLCPSMLLRREVPLASCAEPGAASSYGASVGTTCRGSDGMFSGDFANIRSFRFADIGDGLSNTIMCGEWNYQLEDYTWSSFSCPGNAAVHGQPRWGSHRWAVGYPAVGLGSTDADFNVNAAANICTWRSDHPGGAQFALGDGSVRFVPETIEADILDYLATRDGDEIAQFP